MTTTAPEVPTLERKIESTPRGTLLQSFAFVEPDTIQEAHEINKARITDTSLRNWYGWTADGNMYRLENEKGEQDANGEAVLYFAPRKHNLILREANIADAVSQLRTTENYKPKVQEVQEVVESVKSGETLRVKLADLGLQTDKGQKEEWSYFKIDTANYGSLNATQRALAERVFGKGQDFIDYMKVLNDAGKSTTRVYVLNQNYVKQHAKESAISRVSWLCDFGNGSVFGAEDRNVDGSDGGLRMVRREVAEGDTSQNPAQETKQPKRDYNSSLKVVLENPVRTKQEAASLLAKINEFYQKQAKQ